MSAPLQSVIGTNSINLPTNSDLVRTPPRPYDDQQPSYLARFDFHGIFSDVFASKDSIIAVGPPYLNLFNFLQNSNFYVNGATRISPADVTFTPQDRTARATFILPTKGTSLLEADTLTLRNGQLSLECRVGPSFHRTFAGRNVLMTMNRDNSLENIVDWVAFNARVNEIDAVIVYDNRSSLYSNSELLTALAGVPAIDVAFVVNWQHPYGPTAYRRDLWDSDFGQYTAWEHARWRFLQEANSVTIGDVDELPLAEDGQPCWKKAQQTPDGVFYYQLRDVKTYALTPIPESGRRRHKDFNYFDPSTVGSCKYTYIPSRLGPDQQLLVHEVTGAKVSGLGEAYARHFRGLHKQWRAGVDEFTFELEETVNPEWRWDKPLANALSQNPTS